MVIVAVSREDFVLQHLTAEAEEIKTWELPSAGWAILSPSIEDNTLLLGNFFSGTVGKFDLGKGEITAQVDVGVARSLAGIAQYPG